MSYNVLYGDVVAALNKMYMVEAQINFCRELLGRCESLKGCQERCIDKHADAQPQAHCNGHGAFRDCVCQFLC